MSRKSLTPIQLPADPTQPLEAATKQYVDTAAAGGTSAVLIGQIAMWPTMSNPPGGKWLVCDGQPASRTVFATLFALIGTTFGAGDGSTTFNVPNFEGRMPIGPAGINPGPSAIGNAGGTWSHAHNQTGHQHSVPDASSTNSSHTHVVPNIASSGSHDHSGGTQATNTTTGGTATRVTNITTSGAGHTHTVNDATTTGSGHTHVVADTGTGTGTATPSNGPTSASNPPYLAIHFVIRALP